MGGGSSALNCTSKKKDKNKHRNTEDKPDEALTSDLDKHQNNVDQLRNKAGDVTKKVSPRDKELVEERIRARERKHGDVRSRTEKLQKVYEVLETDLGDIRGKMEQYLAWLTKKEEQVQMTRPEGYAVREAEVKLHYINTICADLENRQFTLDAVSQKVEGTLQELSRQDREDMEQSLKSLIGEHHRVYEVAVAQKSKVQEGLNAREVLQAGLDRINQWLQDRERRIDKQDKLRLASTEVEKQADKMKTLLMEVEKYDPNIEQTADRMTQLKEDCSPEQQQELDEKLAEIQSHFEVLKVRVKEVHAKLRTNISARKAYEADLQKLERWCKDTEMKCAVEPSLDCATEILQEQLKHYQALDETSQLYDSLASTVHEQGQAILPQLYEADVMLLQQQLKSSPDKYNRVSKVIKDRIKTLEDALQTRDQVGESLEEATEWLAGIQDDLRRISRTVGPTVDNGEEVLRQYEDVGEKIANYQPSIAQLNQAVERLRNLGQFTEAEEILRVTSQYEMLGDQVRQQCKKGQQGVAARQQLADQMKELDAMVTECEDSADAVIGQGVPIPMKIETLKEVSEKLQACIPAIFTIGDKAQQIGMEGTEDDADTINTQADELKSRIDTLRKLSDRKIKQCESIQRDREDFESSVDDTINWLDTKEDILASCGSLDLDPVKVKSVLQKHQTLSREALDKLDTVKMKAQFEKAHFDEMDEPIPSQLSEKLEQIATLEDSIKGAINKKEQYLSEATADRSQLEQSMKQISDWIHGAEEMLDSGYDGMDYDTLNDTISEQKDYFSEASMCQDEMDQVMELTERLLPTLDMNDSETLRESLKNTSQKLSNVMASSQRKQQEMEKKCDEWNEYQDTVLQVTQDLQTLEDEWAEVQTVPLVNASGIPKQLKDTREFIEKAEKFRPIINELNERSHDLDRGATEKSRSAINELMNNVNDRWKMLVGSTENKQMTLQDLEAQYEDFSTLLHSADVMLTEADDKVCPQINLDTATCPDLVAQLDETQEIEDLLEAVEPKITAMKKCAQQLQKNLPTAEAKVHTQDVVMAMLEKCERIQDRSKEQRQMLQEEVDDREGFNTEARQTLDWLTETKAELDQLGASKEVPDVMEKVEKLRLSEQEIAIRMEQMRHMAQLQETKYRSQGRELPTELRDQIAMMNDLEKQVATAMEVKEEELLHLREDRQAYSKELQVLMTWLGQATEQLQERVMDIPESTHRHQELLNEFEPFKKKLDDLRERGGDLIRHTTDPVEKQTVQKALADVNKQWLWLQAQAAEKTGQLQDAQKLSANFDAASEAIEQWSTQAEAFLKAEPTWTDFDRVRDQLKQQKRLLKEGEQQQSRLNTLSAITKQMEPLCDTVPAMEKLNELSHTVFDLRALTSEKVNELEETNDQIEDYEKEVAELKQWMEKTRSHLTMRDNTLTLTDQLGMQENLISDIESHRGKAMFVLQKHAELHAAAGEDTPQNVRLAEEINGLLQQAREDCDELRDAVAQQELYEAEMRQLTSEISEAQEELLGSPIQASSVNSLKQQIDEHNELAKKIKSYQARVNELSEKSHDLAARSADLGPLCVRKLYHSGEGNFTVADLARTLHAPLEPYNIPDRSPTHIEPEKYQAPLFETMKSSTVSPVSTSFSFKIHEEGHPDVSRRLGDASQESAGQARGSKRNLSSSPETDSQSRSWGTDHGSPKSQSSSPPTDSGVHFSSVSSLADEGRESLTPKVQNDVAHDSGEDIAVSIQVPMMHSAKPGKQVTDSERESGEQPRKSKFFKGLQSGSSPKQPIKSKLASEEPISAQTAPKAESGYQPMAFKDRGLDTNSTLSRSRERIADAAYGAHVPEDIKKLNDRKMAALSPYKPQSDTLRLYFDEPKDERSSQEDFSDLYKAVDRTVQASRTESGPSGQGTSKHTGKDGKMEAATETKRPYDRRAFPYMSTPQRSGSLNVLPSKFEPLKSKFDKDNSSEALISPRFRLASAERARSLSPSLAGSDPLSKSLDSSLFRQFKRPPSPLTLHPEPSVNRQRPSSPVDSLQRHSKSLSSRPVNGRSHPELRISEPHQESAHKPSHHSWTGTSQRKGDVPISRLLKPGTGWDTDLSRSTPSLLDPQIQGLRERSSSFGSRLRPKASSSLRGSRFDDLSSSWQNLQRQLGVKEKELQVALQKQERYQATVQDVTARMERVQQRLAGVTTAPYKDIDQQIQEHKESEQEIESIREDISRVKERGRQIMETSDPEGYQAMQATLSMLTDKLDSLQAMADDKAKQLQNAVKDRERHDIAMTAYKRRVKELEDWMEEMKVRQATTPQATDSVDMLQQQLRENKDLQSALNVKLQQVADLAVQCDNLCESEPPNVAEKLRMELATLQKNLGDLKLAAIEKQAPLRTAIKESDKRKREMDDYESNLKRMQQWISDTKKLAAAPPSAEQMITPAKKQELQQQLESDLSQHRRLVHQLSSEMKTRDVRPPTAMAAPAPPIKEEDIQPRWEILSKEMAQKKQNLQDLIDKTSELIGPGKYGRRYGPDTLSQLQDVRSHLTSLNDLWQQLQVQVDDKQLRLEQALDFQQRYQDALHNVSGWLDMAEQKIFAPDSTMNSQEKVKENEDLQREIKSLQGEISSMGRAAQELLAVTNADSHDLIRHSLGNLNDRVQILESQARDQGDKLRTVDRQYRQYQEEVQNLEAKLEEARDMMTSPSASAPLSLLVTNMQKIEAQLKKCEGQLEDLKKRHSELTALDPEIISPYEMDTLQSTYMDLQRKVMEKKASLQQSVSVQEQYEKLLQDYAEFLETAQDKLKTEAISARDLEHLKQQLSSHKDFFSDLEVHRAMLDALVAQCDKATKQKHLPQHTKLSNLTYILQDKASLHGQRLERLVRQWGEMEEKFNQLQRFLDTIDQQMPKPISDDDPLQAIQTKINTYHRLQRELNDEKPSVFQVVDKGKQLLHSINCPSLETLITELADKWVDLNTDLSHELKRTQVLGEQLQVFEAESAVFRSWLTAARAKLSGIKQLSATDLRSIATVRSKIDKVLEFRKDVENQLVLKDKVTSIGTQLLENKVYQTKDIDSELRFFEQEWALLEHDINQAEEYLHQAQMDLMPSRQALGELSAWLTEIEEALRDDRNKAMKNLSDLEVLLKKYKSYKIDLSSKQLTVDFVNQEVLQQKDDEIPAPVEQNEFSERLGTLNTRWREVSGHVSDRLKTLDSIHSKWEEFDKAVSRLVGWFSEQEDKMKKYRLIGHEISVRQTLKDCKAMKQSLKGKQMDINLVKEIGESLVNLSREAPGCQRSIQSSLERVVNQQRQLDSQINQVQRLLEDILSQWDCYHGELQVVTQTLTETEYCLQRYTLVGGDIATLKIQVEKLENLMADMERHVARHEKFIALATRLSQVCEAPVRQEIQKTQTDIQTRWQTVFLELRDRAQKFRDCLQQWLGYEEEYQRARTWLDAKEKLCDDLVYAKEDSSRRDDNLSLSKSLQQDLDNFQSQLSGLYRTGDDVTKNMDPASIVSITSRLSGLEQRVITMRQKLAKHIQSLQGDLSQQKRFKDAFDGVNAFLSQAQRILGMDDPNKAADEKVLRDRLNHLKELSSQFGDNLQQLDALNDLGYRLALNETAAAELQDLNHKWHDLYSDTKERCKTLQGILLIQQDFQEKCDLWMTFLAQTETDLSTEIAGNLIDLMDQQRKCEKFESEMYSRQQILHAIISDGQTMMTEGDVEDKEEFQQKLHLLAEQWQSVLRRANQRKAIIDNTIKQWQAFNDSAEKLREWLGEKEEGLEVFNFGTASLQSVKNLVEKAKHNQNEFKLQEDLFRSMNNQGKQLLTRADEKAEEELKVSMAQVQQHWHQLFVKLDERREQLEAILKQWQECEDDIEEILTWLKDTRKTLGINLPTAYEDLQADMHQCKDIEAAFTNAEPKRQGLLAKEKALGKVIEPEDLNVLHQRIRLLNKQWDELKNQASLRGQRIDDTMFRWSNFNEKYKELCDWIDRMEVKVVSSKDYHIEDLLNRMQKDYREEMSEKEKSKNDLVSQGHALMKVSNEVRSSDIDQKCVRVEDKWQHLKAIIGFRQRKLQETLLAVQQLDVSMSNLRKWLGDMELELSAPVIYQECTRKEIQRKLKHQGELQQDIERHSPGVGSVLNLCEVLLHDSDACPTEVEFNGLQSAMKNLERRWRTICQMSPQQRNKIEETWELWQKLTQDCQVFSDWLTGIEEEVKAASPDKSGVSTSKEDFQKCEKIQRKIHEHLGDLENINKQYRRLAREGRTDTAGELKTTMQGANDRWDKLQGQMSTVLREIRNSSSIRDDFKRSKESLMSFLTEVDVQLTNLDHLSSMSSPMKLKEIQRIQEEIQSQGKRFDYVEETAIHLLQKGDSSDAVAIQLELDEFRQYRRQVLDRVALTGARLQRQAEATDGEDELDRLEKDLYAGTPDDPYSLDWDMKEIEAYLDSSPPESPPEKRRALLRARARARSRSKSPVKTPAVVATPVQSVPHTRSRSPTRSYRSKSPRRVVQNVVNRGRSPTREERWSQMQGELSQRGKEAKVDDILEKLVDALMDADQKLLLAERELRSRTPTGPGVEQRSANYLHCMSNCEKSVDDVRRIDRLLKAETGLRTISSADAQVKSIVERWEILQASAIEKDFRLSQHRQDWSQFKADLDNMLSWLDEAEALQHTHKPLPGEITRLDTIIRQHKDFLVQLEAKKTRVISINLTSKELIDITTDEGRLLRDRLKVMNRRWDAICGQATQLQQDLQMALMQCQEFHHTIQDLLLWLETLETKIQQCEPVNIGADDGALWTRLRKLQDIKFDLEKNQPRVMSLKDTADQLLINSESPEMSNAKDKMHIIANRLKALLRLCSSYITSLETRLDSTKMSSPRSINLDLSGSTGSEPGSPRGGRTSTPARFSPFRPGSLSSVRTRPRSPFAITRQLFDRLARPFRARSADTVDAVDGNEAYTSTDLHDVESGTRYRPGYISRVLRAALPLQLLLLLLLGIASLLPMTEEDYSCGLANNFRRSLEPMLRYTDGPPPV